MSCGLEHVYDPTKAVANLRKMLKEKGVIYGYVPYLYYYHSPNNLKFQDYYRFSKDALAYLFRDFQNVELFPIRGRISTPLNILFAGRWKRYVEKTSINILLDKFVGDEKNTKQCSGFNFILKIWILIYFMKKYEAMVLSCMDPRFQPKVFRYLKTKKKAG